MKHLQGKTALLTGADGGLGTPIADELAAAGLNLMLTGYPGAGLESRRARLERSGIRARAMAADLRAPSERERVVPEALTQFGRVDVLMNNAGMEFSSPYHELTEGQIDSVMAVNLLVPMHLPWRVLPGMLERRCGHIVHISSLAAKSSPAFQEPYAASKAALTAFTFSLRGTYRGAGVSASSICPGMVEAGIYARLKDATGCKIAPWLGTVPPERVARAVVRSLRSDAPEIIVSRYPVRPALVLTALSTRLGLWLVARLGVHEFFRRVVLAQRQNAAREGASPASSSPVNGGETSGK